jgi:WD40 repeat protein/serine/threonine protein kinase
MNASDKQRAMDVFEAALDRAPAGRGAYLDETCRGQPKLRAEVESLLEADKQANGFLEPPKQATPPAATELDPLVGAMVGRYHVKRVIAVGGMGSVYEAMQAEPRRTVALKLIRPSMASRSALQRFKHESEILGRLRHPGIAQIYEAGTHGGEQGTPFFAMEYVPGALAITRYAEERRLTTRQRLRLFTKVCDAVQAGHQRGIIHRDLKPANILVDESGQPKLIDFGIARATDADLTIATLQTDVGELVGTLRYMSPEQCEGDAIELDTRSDVYALGVVLFELLTGQLPYDFSTASPFEAPRVIREQEPRRMSAVNRMLRGDIETIVAKALEKDRERRYQSVPELMRDIEHYLSNEPITAKRGRRWYVYCKTVRRHRIAVTVVAAFVIVVVASAASLALLYRDSERQRITSERRSEQLRRAVYLTNITLAHRAYEAGDGAALAQHLSNCPSDLRSWEWRYFKRLADTSLNTLEGHTDTVDAVAVSPDGRLIASGGWDYTLRLWDRDTGNELRTLQSDGFVEQISFSPDGRFVACAGRNGVGAHVWNTSTGERVERCSLPSNHAVAYSPDGARIAAGGYHHEPLRVWDTETGRLLREWPDVKRIRPLGIAWSPDSKTIATARSDGTLILLDAESGQVVRSFAGHTLDVKRVAFSPDGRFLASTSYDTTLRIWSVESGEQYRLFDERGQTFNGVAFSPDSRRVASAGTSAVRVWDLASGEPEAVRLGHADVLNTLVFTPDGKRIVTASHDRTVKIWDARPLEEPPLLLASDFEFASVAVSPDGGQVAAGDAAGQIQVVAAIPGAAAISVNAHRGEVWALAFSHTGRRLASGGSGGRIHLWDAPFDAPLATLYAEQTVVRCLAWAPGDDRLASGHSDGAVRIWDLATGQIIRSIAADRGTVFSVTFNADGTRLITAGEETGVRIWDARSGRHIRDLPTGAGRNVAALSPTGRFVAAGTDEKEVWVWHLETGKPIWKVRGHLGEVLALAFLPDERRLISCGYNNLIMIWDVATGEPTLTLRQHDGGVRSVAVSPDGRWFVSASVDKTVRLWDARLRNGTGRSCGK